LKAISGGLKKKEQNKQSKVHTIVKEEASISSVQKHHCTKLHATLQSKSQRELNTCILYDS
jgi:precorrin isomerase